MSLIPYPVFCKLLIRNKTSTRMSYDLEEDYEAIYQNGCRSDCFGNTSIPVGRCSQYMCSDSEMQERERNNRLSKYEMKPGTRPPKVDKNLALTEYKRSCVGREISSSMDIRPWSCLKRALHHLLLNICLKQDDWMYVCDFVFDRLSAIRQDMVVQRIEGLRYIEVLEGSVRFLIYSMYKLTCTLSDYSQTKPFETIIPQTGRVTGLNNYEMHVIREMKLTMKCLRDCLNSLIIQYQENVPDAFNRPLFEAVNIIVNLPFMHGRTDCSTQFQAKSDLRNSDPTFKLVFKMYQQHLSGSHWTALKQIPNLIGHPLLILAYAPVLAQLQVHLIQLFRKAYSSPGSNRSTVRHLCALICPEWLESDDDERLRFGRFVAIQFGFYDTDLKLCDYKTERRVNELPKDFIDKAKMESQRSAKMESVDDNETRIYALQMILGKNWSLYRELVKIFGVEHILDPKQI